MSDDGDDDPILEQDGLEHTDSDPEAEKSAERSRETTRTSAPKTGRGGVRAAYEVRRTPARHRRGRTLDGSRHPRRPR